MEGHGGRTDKAAAAPWKWRIQDGYTWDEVIRDPVVLVLTALHLLAIWLIFRSIELSLENLMAFIMVFLLVLQYWLWCMFALVGGAFSGSLVGRAVGGLPGGGALIISHKRTTTREHEDE